jgi:hypothetical protein
MTDAARSEDTRRQAEGSEAAAATSITANAPFNAAVGNGSDKDFHCRAGKI